MNTHRVKKAFASRQLGWLLLVMVGSGIALWVLSLSSVLTLNLHRASSPEIKVIDARLFEANQRLQMVVGVRISNSSSSLYVLHMNGRLDDFVVSNALLYIGGTEEIRATQYFRGRDYCGQSGDYPVIVSRPRTDHFCEVEVRIGGTERFELELGADGDGRPSILQALRMGEYIGFSMRVEVADVSDIAESLYDPEDPVPTMMMLKRSEIMRVYQRFRGVIESNEIGVNSTRKA